jgi:hypothetical protein
MINWKTPQEILPPNKGHRCIIYVDDSESFISAYFNPRSGWHDYHDNRIGAVNCWADEFELFDTLDEDNESSN